MNWRGSQENWQPVLASFSPGKAGLPSAMPVLPINSVQAKVEKRQGEELVTARQRQNPAISDIRVI